MSLLRHMRRIVPLAAVVPALCLFSCVNMKDGGVAATSGPGSSTFTPEAIKASPLSVSVEGASDAPTRWNLFDGNTHTAFAPAEAASLRVDLPRNMKITRLRVYGKSSYDVRVYRIEGANRSASPALTIRGEGLSGSWNTITPPEPLSADALVFAFAPVGEPALGVREIEIWSGESGEIPDEGVCSTLDAVKTPERLAAAISHGYPHIHELSAAPAELSIAANGGREHPGTMSFALAMPPVQVRRAFLRFKGKNLCAAPSVERRINGLSWSGGFPVPCDASDEWKEYFEEINPAWLAAGTNTVDFCSARDVSIKELSVVLVTGSGWNWISGVSERNAFDFDTQTSAGVTIGHDMRIDFDSTVEPEHLLLHVPGPAHALARVQYLNNGSWRDIAGVWNVNCAGLVRGWNRLAFPAPVSADGIRLVFSAAPGGPAAPVEINEVRVAASPIAPRNAVRIVFDYPRNGEFFARSAYIRGFVATTAAISSLSLEGKTANADQTAPADGSFNVTLSKDETRYGAQKDDEPWDPALTALTGIGSFSSALHLYENRLSSSSGSGSGSGSGPGSGTDGDGEQSDGSYRATLYPDQSKTILFRDVTLKFPAGSVTKTTVIRIVPLSQGEIPKLGEGMINVTYPAAGYRFLPSGRFEKPVEVYFRYTKDAMKAGQKDEDVFMYYYDVADGKWKRLERLAVEPAITMVTSQTDHFTDIINATLVVPEHPDPLSYNPNSIKDIKAGDPGAGINLIEPPTANSNGDVALSYPIDIPRGRNGMQPQIAVRYNSSGGNGWMGLGWDIPIQSVVIDTKFGVPRYNGSETYLLEGASIVPIGNNQYRQRTEGPFKRILRRGDAPTNFYWEVTDKNGTRFIYGQSAGSRLAASDGGNIFQWCLERVVDTNGNTIVYDYDADNSSLHGLPWRQLYLSRISYTGYGGTAGPYTVEFNRDGGVRKDRIVTCRGGFKITTRYLLSSIDVKYNGSTIRRYGFVYEPGPFFKTLLKEIIQYGEGGSGEFHRHGFTYNNDVDALAGQDFSGFHENELSWGDGSPGRNESESGSANLYLGITPCFLKEKDSSIGVKMGRSYNSSRPREMLIDLDGDGLPDYVYDKGRRYNTNRSSPERDPGQWYTFGGGDVEGLNELGKESGTSNTFGVQMFLFGLGVFNDRNWGTSKGDGYFTDVNGDGLVDYVNGTTVHFNHGADGSGKVVFRNHPPVSFGGGTADIREDDLGSRPYTKEQLDAKYNREDPIRMWQAPYSGTVRVSGPVRLVEKPGTPEAGEYVTNDGVRVSIQKGSSLLWSSAIEKDNHASLAPSVSEIPVNEGERIYFRVNSVDDGSYDAVEWSPVVEYVGAGVDPALLDENGRPAYVFNSAEDFSIAGTDGSWSAPEDGTADFSWTINKEQTSDDVMVQVIKNGEVLMSRHLGWDEIGTFTLSETVSLRGKQDGSGGFPGDTIECRIIADTPIDWTAIRVTAAPTVTYTERNNGYPAYDKNGNPTIVVNIPVYENLFPVRGVEGFPNDPVLPFVSSKTMRARVYFPLQILSVPTGDEEVGVTFAVKRANGLVVKQRYSITKDTIPFGALALDYTIEDLSAGDALYFVVVFDRHDVFEKGYFQIGIPQVYYEDENFPDPDGHIGMGTGHPALYASAIYRPADTPHPFAGGYRNWHYGRWNGERDTLDPALMKLPADGDAQDLAGLMNQYQADPTNEQLKQQIADKTNALNEAYKIFGPMSLDRESGRWRGFDGNDKNPLGDCWISASGMSSTRVVQRYNPVSDTVHMGIVGPGSGSGRGVRKFTRTSENALGASIMASLQESNGTSDTFTEFFDLNGDRYPDVITSDGIQYTGHDGTLGGREGSFAGSVRHNETHNYGASIAIPSEVPYIFKVLVGADGTPKGQAPDGNMTVGISFNTSWGETVTTADFLDVNGDGLPDRVDNGVVYLNTGYGFVYDGDFGLVEGGVRLTKTANLGDGFNIGYAKNLMSFGGGLSGSTSLAAVEYDYIDINGDGLPDLVKMETEQKPAGLAWELVSMITGGASAEKIDWTRGEEMEVWINTGSDFDGPYKWLGANTHLPVSLDASYSMSIPLAFTKKIEVPLPVCPFELIINPSGSGSMQEGASLVRIMDMDGDGYPDQVFADSSGRVVTRMNKTGKTNLLSEVRRPLGGSFAIEYKRQGNTAVMPQSRWTMSRVTLRDGSPDAEGAHTYVSDFRYSNGYYDRTEREFHGFWRVEEIKRGGGAGDVTHTRYYHAGNLTGIGRGNTTENFYRKGLEYASSVRNASGALFQTTDSEFSLHELVAEKAYFPRLTQKSYCYYEGGATCQKSTRQTYEYDQYGNVSKFTDHGEDDDPADDLTAVIAYSYSPDSHIVAKPKLMTVTGGDGREYRKRAGTYDSLGNLRKISQYLDGGGIAETNIDYYPNGNLMRVTAPVNSRGQRYTENYAYDGAVGVYIEEIRDSHGYASYAKYDYRYGVPVSTADINGQNTLYQYDEFGRLRAVYGPYDIGQGSPTIRVSYHTSSSPAWALVRNKGYWESNDTVNTVTVIDGLKRVIQVKKTAEVMKDGEKQSGMIISGKEVYDALGRVERQGQPVFRPGSENGYTPVSAEKPTVNTYDVVGRKTRIAFPDGTSISNFYGFEENMFLTRTTDQEGKIKKVLKDVQGQIVAVKEGPGEDETNYEYNPMNEIERVIDADLNVTEIDYDNLGRRISINNPDAGLVEYNYDQAGNLIRKITPNLRRDGKYIRYIYYFNHLERIDYPGMANTYYTYGSAGADGNGAGRIVAVDNGVLREKRAYGRLGELVRTDRTIAGTTYTTKYEFDSMGRMRRMVFPDSETLVYAYDRGGLLRHAATHENGIINTYLKDIGYDEFGQRVQVKYGNDAVSTYEYDDTTRRLMHLKTVNKDGTVLQNIEYAYDRVGNILSKKNSNFMTSSGDAKTSEQTYAYDDLHRLTSSNGTFSKESWLPFFTNRTNTYTNSFTYNSIGNILNKNQVNKGRFDDGSEVTIAPTTYTFDYEYGSFRPHAVTKAGTKTFTYDLNGNMLTQVDTASGLNRNIAWDDENRITSTNDSGTVTSYAYDDKGERVIKNGKFGNVVYVNNNFAVRNGTLKSKHIFAGNTRLASKLVDSSTDMGTYYYHADHLGSSNAITTKTGSFHEHIEYFPYGETWVEEKAAGGVELGYKFTAKELDAETGLYYFGARYYDAVLSKWCSADPALVEYLPYGAKKTENDLHAGGVYNSANFSLYSYAYNNPVIMYDPDGNKVYLVVVYTRAGVGLHTYLKLIPDKPSDFSNQSYNDIKQPADQITNENASSMKNKSFTSLISGFGRAADGEEAAFSSSRLVTEANWDKDVKNKKVLKEMEIKPQDGMSDTDLIKNIVSNFREYRDTPFDQKLEYELSPDKGENEGNCNSLSHGLLKASGAKNIPSRGKVEQYTGSRGMAKGWDLPVNFNGKHKKP